MSLEVFWRLPVAGDGRSVAAEDWQRGDFSEARKQPHSFARTGVQRDGYTYYDLLLQIGRAAEITGFDGLWIPEAPGGEEPLIVAGSLAREVPRLRLVPALRPALLSAVYATKIAVSFQRLTGGRLAWRLTADASEGPHWHGRSWSEGEQLRRTSEFLDVSKGFWSSAPFTYEGEFYEVVDGGFAPALQGETFPKVYLSGTSSDALALSAKHADVHFFPLGPTGEVRDRIAALSKLAAQHGRSLGFGLEVELLGRHDAGEAWAEAERQWQRAQGAQGAGSKRAGGSFEQTRLGGNLWSGYGALGAGVGVGLVGAYAELAQTLREYAAVGVSTFVLGAHPHIEEAYSVGEHVLPFLEAGVPGQERAAS